MSYPSDRMKNAFLISLSVILWTNAGIASEPMVINGERDKIGYSVGYQIGEDLNKQKTAFDPEALLKGVEDALAGAKPQFSDEEMRTTLAELKKKIMAQEQTKHSERQATKIANKDKNWAEGRDFLDENALKEGVVTLSSGLQYKVLAEGTGKKPGPQDTVAVNYLGTLTDGTEFGSSYRKGAPEKRRVDAMIPGMKEALQLMREGAKWRLFVPYNLAYGERGPLADRTVIIEVELVSVESLK